MTRRGRLIGAVRRNSGPAALVISLAALGMTTTGAADAAKTRAAKVLAPKSKVKVVTKPQAGALLLLGKNRKFPASAIPKVASARNADRLGNRPLADLAATCNAESVDLGSWCLMSQPYAVPNEDIGKNDYFYASRTCVEMGGYLPTAAQLLGAVARVKLAGTIDDDRLTASIDEDATDGTKDRREMTSTLITTQGGSSSAGSQGVSEGSRGDPRVGEPDPVPLPANPQPETLQYVTVYDNRDKGGFAGAKPVAQAETFRCAFDKQQGQEASEEG
ncbi:MAG: hypothetical protein JHC84_19180 [Solirubrobacteraceae bacterium]|nr:hypothetical protein [Solirubrobacteraceae bacterium]